MEQRPLSQLSPPGPPVALWCAGAVVWDELIAMDEWPGVGGFTRVRSRTGALGGVGRCALTAAGLGHRVTVRGQVGDGLGGQAVRAEFAAAGVACELSGVPYDRVTTVIVTGTDRTLVGAPRTVPLADPGPLPVDVAAIVCDGAEARAFGAAVAAAPSAWASLDVGDRPRPYLGEALLVADVVVGHGEHLASLVDARSGAEAATRLVATRAKLVALTDGAHPVQVFTPESSFSLTPPRVKAVDTTGCGDVFHGALIASLASGADARQAVRTALEWASSHAAALGNALLWDRLGVRSPSVC